MVNISMLLSFPMRNASIDASRSALSPPPASAGPRRQRPGRPRRQGRAAATQRAGGARRARRRPPVPGGDVLTHGEEQEHFAVMALYQF